MAGAALSTVITIGRVLVYRVGTRKSFGAKAATRKVVELVD